MVLDLPDPVTVRLARSPLSLVVCQVRHERNPAVADTKLVLAVHEALRATYPKVDENAAQEIGVLASPAGVQAMPGETTRGWRFRSKDDAWTVVVMPDFFALETTQYTDWPDYSTRLRDIASAIESFLAPALERRLGIRYVDRLMDPDVLSPTDWIGKIHENLLGALAHPGFGTSVVATQTLAQIHASAEVELLLRHGSFQDVESGGKCIYLLDHDCFREGGRPFSVDNIMTGADQIHRVSLQVFQAALTAQYFQELLKGTK